MNHIATAAGASTPARPDRSFGPNDRPDRPALTLVAPRPSWRDRLEAATTAAEAANRRPCPVCGGPTDLVPFYVGGRGWVRYVLCERGMVEVSAHLDAGGVCEYECDAPMREASCPEDYL